MSYLDCDRLKPAELVAHFVVECRGQSLFLPYQDYAVIDTWLRQAPDADELLLVLADVLPAFYGGSRGSRSLMGVAKLVSSRLADRRMQSAEGQR